MKKYSSLNHIIGWAVFFIAAFTYLSTLEPTASFWDCGEFIAASFKLEVGHPPGAPFFLLVGRIFSMFAGNNTANVALMVNALSGLASAFTILFLFWTISHLARKMLSADQSEPTLTEKLLIFGSAVVGSLAYTFSDTFWFSAVEGEVYASSSLFTAVVFWAILKWENVANERYADRWLILIAYLMGLSIGVHLLNLLALPAIVLIYYFKKYTVTFKGVVLALLTAGGVLGGTMYILIPGFVKFAALFERFFVNTVGLPYWYGFFIYIIMVSGVLMYLIYFSRKTGKILLNTATLIVTVILIGYSSYALVVIRSNANPPMDQNNPENLFNLLSYLNREQYGDRPLIYGQYFNAPSPRDSKGNPVFVPADGRYKIITYKPKYKYSDEYKTIMPRMYSNQPDHIDAYLRWTNMKKDEVFQVLLDEKGNAAKDRTGETMYDYNRPKQKPGYISNLVFLVRYQLGYMYFRYFMWNFSGRQNDIQGLYKEDIASGNWITGMKILDASRLGSQDKLPKDQLNNKARNKYYMFPLIIGLFGLLMQYRSDKKNFWVVMSLFFFTGVAIVLYLNQPPLQPRERDYAYAGSFYAFAIWIGLAVISFYKAAQSYDAKYYKTLAIRCAIGIAVLAIFDYSWNQALTFTWSVMFVTIILLLLFLLAGAINNNVKNNKVLAVISCLLFIPVPLLMAVQNWDDHNRSGRYIARDFAANYLNSCEKGSILFTNGDNDTFPLWYVQEVEGVRTDIRVINLSYLSADWYINQMRNKVYDAEPVAMTLTPEQYQQGKREIVYFYDRLNGYIDLVEAVKFIANDQYQNQILPGVPERIYYFPQHKFSMEADSGLVFSNGTIKAEMASKYVPRMLWEFRRNYITKNHLMALDFLATNNWQRPIYYAITVGNENYLSLESFFEMHGLSYRIVPAITVDRVSYVGGMNSSVMYDNMMNKFLWGGIEKDIYLDENCLRMLSNMRHNFGNLATVLINENKVDSARNVMDRCLELFPNEKIPFDLYTIPLVENFYKMALPDKAREISGIILRNTYDDIEFMLSLESRYSNSLTMERRITAYTLSELMRIANRNGDKGFAASIDQKLQDYGPALNRILK